MVMNRLQSQNIDPELNLIVNALESAIDLCKVLGKDPGPFRQKLQEIVVPADNDKRTED